MAVHLLRRIPVHTDPSADAFHRPTAVAFQREGAHVTARISGPAAQETLAESVLHRAGFVQVVRYQDRYHRLPTGMTDPAEQRHTVTRAIDLLYADGFDVTCDPNLLEPGQAVSARHEIGLGDRVGHLAGAVAAAGHTRDVSAALSELTAPGDGVLQRVSEVLNASADWWQGLGADADPHFAGRLRYITEQLDSYFLEIHAMQGVLADRHTSHPKRGPVQPERPAADRLAAARSTSPTAHRPTGTSPLPPAPAYPAPPAPAAFGPRR
jgi:hypothetical protein